MADYSSDEEEEVKYTIVYEGEEAEYHAVEKDGVATATFDNGDTYTGEYRDGKRNGKGKYVFETGNSYEGDYVDNEKHGYGVQIYPDNSRYEGEWQNNKKHGEGTYIYANNDSYVGGFQADMKHGKGTYVYANLGSKITGQWSNNKVMHGTWKRHDGSSYTGRYSHNKPFGHGLFQFSNGNVQSGSYTGKGDWIKDKFKKPALDAKPTEAKKASAKDQAVRLINKSLLVLDLFEGIQEKKGPIDLPVKPEEDGDEEEEEEEEGSLASVQENIPNFRQAKEEYPVFASGQPDQDSMRLALDYITGQGFESVIWVCGRDTPVVFVKDISISPRPVRTLNDPLTFPDLPLKQMAELDAVFQAKVRSQLRTTGGVLEYIKEARADAEEDVKRVDLVLTVEQEVDEELDEEELELIKEEDKYPVKTFREIFKTYAEEGDYDVKFVRYVLDDRKLPTVTQLEELLTLLVDIGESQAVYFQSHTGIGQSSIGMLVAALIKKLSDEEPEEDEEEEEEFEDEEEVKGDDLDYNSEEEDEEEDEEVRAERRARRKEELKAKKEAEAAAAFVADYSKGEYTVIMQLVAALESGEKVKADVDQAIERCGEYENVISSLFKGKEAKDSSPEAVAAGQTHLELYFNLIVFHAYLRENREDEFTVTYSKWLEGKANVLAILGTRTEGALSAFDWS